MFESYRYVNSTAIAIVAYSSELQTLRVVFHSGRVYDYQNVPVIEYGALVTAMSVGV